MEKLLLTAGLLLMGIAIFAIVLQNRRTRKTMNTMGRMLEDAAFGTFAEAAYDESVLSSLECKLSRYLAANRVASQTISTEKNAIKTLISDISHQTKTPIANLLLYTELLCEQKNLPVQWEELLSQIHLQSEKLNFLIGALIKTSRLETGIIAVSAVPNLISSLLDDIISQIAPQALEKSIQITLNCDDHQVLFDPKWTGEALYNILDNAVKYSPPGGRIHISAVPYEIFYRIDIADNGMGISEEEQSKIFSRFYRSSAATDISGVGIGLYLSREILSMQKGYIKLRSTLGVGSVFSVFLPMEK